MYKPPLAKELRKLLTQKLGSLAKLCHWPHLNATIGSSGTETDRRNRRNRQQLDHRYQSIQKTMNAGGGGSSTGFASGTTTHPNNPDFQDGGGEGEGEATTGLEGVAIITPERQRQLLVEGKL